MTDYNIQILDADCNHIELDIKASTDKEALELAKEGMDGSMDGAMIYVFRDGEHISREMVCIPRAPMEFNLFSIHQLYEMSAEYTMEEAEREYGSELKLMLNGKSCHAVMLYNRFDKTKAEVVAEVNTFNGFGEVEGTFELDIDDEMNQVPF